MRDYEKELGALRERIARLRQNRVRREALYAQEAEVQAEAERLCRTWNKEQKDVDDIVVVTMNAASKANVAKVKAPEKLTMRVIDLTGIVHGIYEVNEGESQFTLPSTPGVYLLEMSYPSGRREIHKVVVR